MSDIARCALLRDGYSLFCLLGGSSFADQPPQYDSVNAPTTSAGNQPDIFEENQYGEMRPAESNVVRDPSAQGPVQDDFAENQYGEIHRSGTDPERLPPNTSSSSQNFGRDTPERSKEFRSGETYAENRYGELGRADTYVDDQVHMSDKVKGNA